MSKIRLYLDEDAMSNSLLKALRSKEIDVISVQEAGTEGFPDNQQLDWATSQERVIYSHNISDFCRLHSQYLETGRNHAGIALISQDTAIGDQVRAVIAFVSQTTSENMKNECIFLRQFLSV
ncbi:DUF5615 family PIN-like protein [Synechocystis sp. PCC 7339]|uniref:DUF5615 family PIN-like protein n=1 Tax=unclassified Synechocystis TaxID=2640012 RepID=UPI001BAFB72F|nr:MULTISPECIES: DUF5615 family PIN-like protein [unclassified Synechocystis]QUS60968.1 DUF5615 family PIN-like protein [Synechocystis sp. PCC 7338]UAJ73151.1 DUF5615 family PIN-like protein [Synechocystis sp. PCC 7339]